MTVLTTAGGVTVARALGSPTRAEIYEHLREAGEERTVRDIAARFELHPNVARTHLELLADAGLVRVGRRKHPGGGRPAKVYTALDGGASDESAVAEHNPVVVDTTLLVRLLASLLEAPGTDSSGRPVVASARRATLAGRGHEVAAAEGRRLIAALRGNGGSRSGAATPEEAAALAIRALRPSAPQLRVVRSGDDWVDVTGLRDLVAPLVGVRPDLADALERGLLAGALAAAAGMPIVLADVGTLTGGAPVWRARSAIQPSARAAVDPTTSIDTRGQARETGVVHAMRVVARLRPGDVLEVLTEGAGSPAAFARWLDRSGHQLIAVERAADDAGRPAIRLLIRKGM